VYGSKQIQSASRDIYPLRDQLNVEAKPSEKWWQMMEIIRKKHIYISVCFIDRLYITISTGTTETTLLFLEFSIVKRQELENEFPIRQVETSNSSS
jgi:hypothetical protein